MAKEMNYFNYYPGDITHIGIIELDNYLSRITKEDNQRCTCWNYIYADDNLIGGK